MSEDFVVGVDVDEVLGGFLPAINRWHNSTYVRALFYRTHLHVWNFLTDTLRKLHITPLDMELALLQTARITKVMRSKTRGAGTMQTL